MGTETESIFFDTEQNLLSLGFSFERVDLERPWGGFFVIDEIHVSKFLSIYFPNHSVEELTKKQKISPKILVVAPNKRLSWQYHNRRAEVWRVIEGTVGVIQSDNDEQTEMKTYDIGDLIVLKKGERHRLVGLENWGKVAEIWQHTDPDHPSDENDIIRLQDDFKRTSPE